MIGNDVVDLSLARKESDWRREGYVKKIFTSSEINIIEKSANPDQTVWLLWSLKESTYKAMQRLDCHKGLYPIKIEIQNIISIKEVYYSKIKLFNVLFYGKSRVTKNSVHSIVTKNQNALSEVKHHNNYSYTKDSNGLPISKNKKEVISVSHHGNYLDIVTLTLNA